MLLNIDTDYNRFRQIIKGKIKQNLRKYMSQGEMIGRKGKDIISIPLPQIDLPNFRFGDNGGFQSYNFFLLISHRSGYIHHIDNNCIC